MMMQGCCLPPMKVSGYAPLVKGPWGLIKIAYNCLNVLTKPNDVIFYCLWRHSCQFKPHKLFIVFLFAFVPPPTLRKVPPPMTKPIPSPRGSFSGLSIPKQSTKPTQIETWNTINQCRFCQFLECQAPPHKFKANPQKRKAPLLKTFWQRFCTKPLYQLQCVACEGGTMICGTTKRIILIDHVFRGSPENVSLTWWVESHCSTAEVGNLRPAGRIRSAKENYLGRSHLTKLQ